MLSGRALIIVAGSNGAGKSTFASHGLSNLLPADTQMLNPDVATAAYTNADPSLPLLQANKRAADATETSVLECIRAGRSVLIETVLSTDKYRGAVAAAKAAGFRVVLVYVVLSSPDLAVRRVRDRVAAGGHDVDESKIRARWLRSLDTLPWFAEQADDVAIFLNDEPEGKPVLIADGSSGRLTIHAADACPELTQRLAHLTR